MNIIPLRGSFISITIACAIGAEVQEDERIAVGGLAEVFLAVRPGLEGFEKTLAIKRIRPHLSNEDAFTKMFLFEAKLAAQLQHPNIVQIYELGKINNSYFIAMEYISGRDMSISRALPVFP